ncbi:MAG: hypothetical protein ACRYG8_28005 [Janthinobacterium lividum]
MGSQRSLPFITYEHALDGICDAAMLILRRLSDEMKRLKLQPAEPSLITPEDMLRQFAILSAHVRRAVMVSRYLESRGRLSRAPKIGLMPTLEIVLRVLAAHRVDADTYNHDMDMLIEAEEDDFSDIPGCRPVTLIAELLRDVGMVAHAVPPDWLADIPAEFRLLAARTAAAAIRPRRPALRIEQTLRF